MEKPVHLPEFSNWVQYWDNDDFWTKQKSWTINTDIFCRGALPHLNLSPEDDVLNVGCGAGFLEARLAPQVRYILAVDTSARFVSLCRENNQGSANVEAATLGEDYTDLTVFGRKFSLILSVGVVIYYKNVGELEALIRSALKCLKPGGRILIAELMMRKGPLGKGLDCCKSLWQSVRHGYFGHFAKTALGRFFGGSNYRSFLSKEGVLYFSTDEVNAIGERLGVDIQWLHDPVSLIVGRPSLLIMPKAKIASLNQPRPKPRGIAAAF